MGNHLRSLTAALLLLAGSVTAQTFFYPSSPTPLKSKTGVYKKLNQSFVRLLKVNTKNPQQSSGSIKGLAAPEVESPQTIMSSVSMVAVPTPTPTPAPSSPPAPPVTIQALQTVSVHSQSVQDIAFAMLKDYGWGGYWDAFSWIVNHESGFNTFATNPSSHAYGICQSLPDSKMASAGADWRTNPATQIKWCIGYIAGRYQNPLLAKYFWVGHHWF